MTRLEEGADGRDAWVVFMGTDPRFAPLRDEPRFRALLARVGFPGAA